MEYQLRNSAHSCNYLATKSCLIKFVTKTTIKAGREVFGIGNYGKLGAVDIKRGAWCSVVVKALRYLSDGLGIDSRSCHWGFFSRGYRQNHVPWGRLSL